MLNFTGQTRKRVVNLGDRKRGGSSKSFLEQSRIERRKREENRQIERSTQIIQRYIRTRIDLVNASEDIKTSWTNAVTNWQTDDDWNKWLIEFSFLCHWYFIRRSRMEWDMILESFIKNMNSCSVFKIYPRSVDSLLKGFKFSLLQYNKFNDSEKTLNLIIQSITIVLEQTNVTNFHGLGGCLISSVKLIESSKLVGKIVSIIFMINVADSSDDFIQFLSTPDMFEENFSNLMILRSTLPNTSIDLPDARSLDLLINFLIIHGCAEFKVEDYQSISAILLNVRSSIHEVDDLEFEEFCADNKERRGNMYVPKSSIAKLDLLFSSKFMKQLSRSFVESAYNVELAVELFANLMSVFPGSKARICVQLTIIPNSYRWFYHQILSSPVAVSLIDKSVSKTDFMSSVELREVYVNLSQESVKKFWKTLYTFEELYSYWLIVSNDYECFDDEKLNLSEISVFLQFLKALCLTLITNQEEKLVLFDYDEMKDISISLLSQLHLKNLRLNFIPASFWTLTEFWNLNDLNLNLDGLIQVVAEEEERSVDEEDGYAASDSDVDGFGKSMPKSTSANQNKLLKLNILKKMPFFIPFKQRVRIFQSLIDLDKQRLNSNPFAFSPRLKADIRRENVLGDAFDNFYNAGASFKHPLQVSFFNEYGQEAGIDGGGITKEFLTSLMAESTKSDLFRVTNDHQLYPNSDIFMNLYTKRNVHEQQKKLSYLKFIGSVVGKCLYENVLIDVAFAPFFSIKWSNESMKSSINDLNTLDHELFTNLMKLTVMSAQELEELDVYFTTNEIVDGRTITFDLIYNGAYVKVNSSNRLNYIHQLSNFKLNQSLHYQTKHFLEGLFEVISPSWLRMFDYQELQMLISGGISNIDVQDWMENVEYGGYFDDDLTVKYFWEVVLEMNAEDKCKLIKFVTSVSRAPLLGFGSLSPKFGIRNGGRDVDRLPTASTCVNLLKIPDYKDKELIRRKLLYAINTEAGFDLS